MEAVYFLGFAVGFLIGLIGIGGGSIMTPTLILLGIPPRVAVGTDLVYNAVTKFVASLLHYEKGNVNVKTSLALLSGATPALFISAYLLTYLGEEYGVEFLDKLLTRVLAVVLIVTSIVSIYKAFYLKPSKRMPNTVYLVLTGFVVGMLVQMTSVGSGVLVTLFLLLFTGMVSKEIVGTETLFGFVVTLLASLIHAKMGNVDYKLAVKLTVPAIFGVALGIYTNSRLYDKTLRLVISCVIFFLGVTLLTEVS